MNGVCLTVTHHDGDTFTVGLAPETLRRTNLGDLAAGDQVNLERALAAGARMGGHYVQGHVDGVGVIKAVRPEGDSLWMTFSAPEDLLRYLVVNRQGGITQMQDMRSSEAQRRLQAIGTLITQDNGLRPANTCPGSCGQAEEQADQDGVHANREYTRVWN